VSPTFRSLRIPNYRLWASGAIVSNTGTWMQRVAQDWLVLTQLTNNSGVAVGITTGLQVAPMLLLAPIAGAVGDRFTRRHVLLMTQSMSGLLALGLGALVVTDTAQLWHVYVLAALLGVAAAIDAPARQTFVGELVGTEDLPNAVGLNSASFHAGRLIGPGVAGLLIHWFGTGPVFLINGVTFGAVVISLLRMKVADLRPQPKARRGRGSVREGLAYVRNRSDILLVLVIVGMIGTFGLNFQMTTALMARLAFDKGSGEYGLLGSIMAVGSLAGALLAARRERPQLRLVVGAAFAFGVFATVSALMPTYWLFAASLVPVGLASLTLMTSANATVQLSTTPAMRGRVMALYLAIFMGGTPVGAPVIGWVGEEFGARWTILLGGIVSVITALLAVVWLQRTGRVRIGAKASWPFVVFEERIPMVAADDVTATPDGAVTGAPQGAVAAPPQDAVARAPQSAPTERPAETSPAMAPATSASAAAGGDRDDITPAGRDATPPAARARHQEARGEKARTDAAAAEAGDAISAA
jgi:MFS family permease